VKRSATGPWSCSRCFVEKPAEDFTKASAAKGGYYSRACKVCEYAVEKAGRAKQPLRLPASDGSKLCSKCRVEKPRVDFNKNARGLDGRRTTCRTCDNVNLHKLRPLHPRTHEGDQRRFWSRVNKEGPDHPYDVTLGTCWLWTAKSSKGFGYGCFSAGGKHFDTHRYSLQLENGPIPNGLHVLHGCDRPACVRTSHLRLGTQLDNNRDMFERGRNNPPRGSEHSGAKINEGDVLTIRARRARGETCAEIAKDYNVHAVCISNVDLRKTWKHVK
jgi:hypothetical protein